MRIGIVAGEASGDLLGAGLIREIKQHYPDAEFEGIAGPQMLKQGAQSFVPMERLAVMGIVEVLGRYRELLGVRKRLKQHFIKNPPDLFIGIDAPEFNLGLELSLRSNGIKTVQYVSPSVWAWRQGRLKKIAKAVDRVLALFPHEAQFYKNHNVPVDFVGHPLADMIPMRADVATARKNLNLPDNKTIIAILPGSRSSELKYLSESFIQAAHWCMQQHNDLYFVAPMANQYRREQFQNFLDESGLNLPITLVDGQAREVMAAAKVVLLASGTATLEALLLKKPMVVAYKMSTITYYIIKMLSKISHYSLPNILAKREVVPELIQKEVTPEKLGAAILNYLQNPSQAEQVQQVFSDIHAQLKLDANKQAANAILKMLEAP